MGRYSSETAWLAEMPRKARTVSALFWTHPILARQLLHDVFRRLASLAGRMSPSTDTLSVTADIKDRWAIRAGGKPLGVPLSAQSAFGVAQLGASSLLSLLAPLCDLASVSAAAQTLRGTSLIFAARGLLALT